MFFRDWPIRDDSATVAIIGFLSPPRERIVLEREPNMIVQYRETPRIVSLVCTAIVGTLMVIGVTTAGPAPVPQDQKAGQLEEPASSDDDEEGLGDIAGRCVSNGKPLGGVKLALYLVDRVSQTLAEVRTESSTNAGEFEFDDVPRVDRQDLNYAIVASRPGHASSIRSYWGSDAFEQPIVIDMPLGASLKGRVVDERGNPVVGADVWIRSPLSGKPLPEVLHSRTDQDGRYDIKDVTPWNADLPQPGARGVRIGSRRFFFSVSKPGFATARPSYAQAPDVLDEIKLVPEAVIEGRVIDQDSGEPVAGIVVCLQSTRRSAQAWREVNTDERGVYRMTSLPSGTFNLWAKADNKTCVALDSMEAVSGRTVTAPEIALIDGGWMVGRIVDDLGKPMAADEAGRPYRIGLHGPARPKSGPAVESVVVDSNGWFHMRVPPGKNFPYIMSGARRDWLLLDSAGNPVEPPEVMIEEGETHVLKFTFE